MMGLHYCAWSGHADAIRLLVSELGADVGVMNNRGTTPPSHGCRDRSQRRDLRLA